MKAPNVVFLLCAAALAACSPEFSSAGRTTRASGNGPSRFARAGNFGCAGHGRLAACLRERDRLAACLRERGRLAACFRFRGCAERRRLAACFRYRGCAERDRAAAVSPPASGTAAISPPTSGSAAFSPPASGSRGCAERGRLAACLRERGPLAACCAGAPPRRDVFARLDRNGDGAIDQSEWQKFQQFRFRRLDTDKNGSLSASEMEQGGRRPAGGGGAGQPSRLARLDANGDGTITEQEFLAGQTAMLKRLDADGNGSVSKTEFARVTDAMAGRQQSAAATGPR